MCPLLSKKMFQQIWQSTFLEVRVEMCLYLRSRVAALSDSGRAESDVVPRRLCVGQTERVCQVVDCSDARTFRAGSTSVSWNSTGCCSHFSLHHCCTSAANLWGHTPAHHQSHSAHTRLLGTSKPLYSNAAPVCHAPLHQHVDGGHWIRYLIVAP